MTLPNPGLDRQVAGPEHVQDEIPATERGQDVGRGAASHDLVSDVARPLTKAEREAAEHDTPVAERVYAPASERVPKEPLPGHRDMVEHTDTATPEREAISDDPPPSSTFGSSPRASMTSSPSVSSISGSRIDSTEYSTEPTFTRVARPSATIGAETPTPSPYASFEASPGFAIPSQRESSDSRSWDRRVLAAGGVGYLLMMGGLGVGVWLFMRWQRERNKPVNRLRRRAAGLRRNAPSGSDVAQPIMGLTAALASMSLVLMRQLRNQPRAAAHTISEADWQHRLVALKERWGASHITHR
jgi:hypothetical protein